MPEPSPARALQELIAQGLIDALPVALPLPGGNADRRDRTERTSWRVNLPDGRPVRLLIGRNLASLAQRQTAFARACPDLVPAPIFHQSLQQTEAFAEPFIEGTTLESIAHGSPARTQTGFTRTCALLTASMRPSTEAARQAEWQAWCQSIDSLDLWTPREQELLRDVIWPGLYPLISTEAPALRWSNGDFTSNNLLLDQAGLPHLIDQEFAHETHFYHEDAARFHSLSPAARQWPELFSACPLPGPAWHLFFWLRQLGLETAQNSATYLERMRPVRLSVIRRLSEITLGCPLAGWSVEPTTLHHTMEFARWEQTVTTALRFSGWCHVPEYAVRSIIVTQGAHLLASTAPSTRSDVQDHFCGAATAINTGFSLAIPLREPDFPLIVSALTEDGTILPFRSLLANHLPGRGPWVEDYTQWAALYDPDPPVPVLDVPGPLFSVLVPTYNTPLDFLCACLESVRHQHYSRWELCIVDDGSSDHRVPEYLQQFASSDSRIRLRLLPVNGGIAGASNAALAMASGQYVVMLDHDDILRPHALLEFARYLSTNPDTDALYSDEDKLSPEGQRIAPFFKPDFSPEYLLGVMYVGHALCVRTNLARVVGGFDPAYDGIQDYEFFLRISEHTQRIGHTPRILYHWRQSPRSSSLYGNIKGNINERQAAAVRTHLQRQNRTESVQSCGHHLLQLHATRQIVVEVIRMTKNSNPMVVLYRAANTSRADVLVLLTIEPLKTSEHWLRELAALAERPDSGLIAPLLVSPEGLVQESGWAIGPSGITPIMRGFDPTGDGYIGSLICTREVSAVSPACCAVRRELILNYLTVDETWWEYCVKLRANKLFHRVCPTARVQLSPNQTPYPDRFGTTSTRDPFLNPNYNLQRADYSLVWPQRTAILGFPSS